jgi:hypothetical protein
MLNGLTFLILRVHEMLRNKETGSNISFNIQKMLITKYLISNYIVKEPKHTNGQNIF